MLLSTTQGFVARWSGHPDKLIFGLQYGKINTKETVYKAGWLGQKGSLIRACSSACFYLSLPSQVTLRQEDTKGEKITFSVEERRLEGGISVAVVFKWESRNMLYLRDTPGWFKERTQVSSWDSCKHSIAKGLLSTTALHGGTGFGRGEAHLDS